MNTVALSSFMVLLTIVSGITVASPAFADHATASVSIPAGTSVPGCETTDECWIPNEVTVDVGGEVTWSNDDTAAHTVTAGTAADGLSGEFDSSLFMAGTTFSHKFESAGSFPYFCMVHPWMEGLVIVQEAEAEEPEEKPTMSGDASATGMLPDGTMVSIMASKATAGEKMKISTQIKGKEHVNYDIKVTQNGMSVLDDMGAHSHDGKGTHETAPLASADPVEITVQFNGYGIPPARLTGEAGEVVFSNIVPEFGTIAMMILVVSIISIVAITAKTRVIPRL